MYKNFQKSPLFDSLQKWTFLTVLYIPRLPPTLHTNMNYRSYFLVYIEDFPSRLVFVLHGGKLIAATNYLKKKISSIVRSIVDFPI